jgi:hypothetical protein
MGLGRKSREEILQEEHDKFIQEVEDSGLPFYMIDYYGMPYINIPPDDEEDEEDNQGEG